MTLGHLGQLNEIHCDSRTHKVLSNFTSTLGHFLGVHRLWSFQAYIFNLSLLIFFVLGYLRTFCFFCLSFLPSLLRRDSRKNERFTKKMFHVGQNSKIPLRIRQKYLQIILKFAECGPLCEGTGKLIMNYEMLRLGRTFSCSQKVLITNHRPRQKKSTIAADNHPFPNLVSVLW